jgi:hypothetical protein
VKSGNSLWLASVYIIADVITLKIMKPIISTFNFLAAGLAVSSLLFITSCDREGGIKERPENIISSSVRIEILQKISEKFPESKNLIVGQPALFDASAQKHVVLSKESEVYVTYVSEGAGYQNSFGWYSYNTAAKPGDPSALKLNLLFPTVSNRVLKQGDMLQLGEGKFPAGTVIGFFLIIQGWQGGQVHYDRETYYTNFEFNTDDQQQHVLFRHEGFGDLVLAFEDELTSLDGDKDFNDIIFTVTDNKEEREATSFDVTNVVQF